MKNLNNSDLVNRYEILRNHRIKKQSMNMEQELFIQKGMVSWIKKWAEYIKQYVNEPIVPDASQSIDNVEMYSAINNSQVVNILTSMALSLI